MAPLSLTATHLAALLDLKYILFVQPVQGTPVETFPCSSHRALAEHPKVHESEHHVVHFVLVVFHLDFAEKTTVAGVGRLEAEAAASRSQLHSAHEARGKKAERGIQFEAFGPQKVGGRASDDSMICRWGEIS